MFNGESADRRIELGHTRLAVERVLLRWSDALAAGQPVDAAALLAKLDTSYQALWPIWWDDTGRSVYEGPEKLPEQTASDEQLRDDGAAAV